MKKLIMMIMMVFMLGLTLTSKAQNEPLLFTEVVEVNGVTQEELKTRASIWFTSVFTNAKEVIQLSDDNQIIGKGNFHYKGNVYAEGYVNFTVKIQLKEGRYKYEFTDFVHEKVASTFKTYDLGLLVNAEENPNKKPFGTTTKWWNKVYNDVKEQSKHTANILTAGLKEAMETPTTSNDW